jgi:GWxTD domain-containing protein
MKRIVTMAAVAMFAAVSLFAAGRGQYEEWGDSPEAYFMTKSERDAWAQVRTEADAQKFIDEFVGKREAGFREEVKKRAANADKYLTIGKLPGSKTLRGKLIVLFGPPSGLNVAERTKSSVTRTSPEAAGALSNAGSSSGGGKGGSDDVTNLGNTMGTASQIRTYTISFPKEVATRVDRKDLTFIVEADGATGKDRFSSRSAEKDADTLFELAAWASMKK